MISAGSAAEFAAAFDRQIVGGVKLLAEFPKTQDLNPALYSSARVYSDRIREPNFFYSQRVVPKNRPSRSRGASRRSVRAIGHRNTSRRARDPGSRLVSRIIRAGASAGVVMGHLFGSTHARVLEAGRRGRPFSPGATGPLPAQNIFGRGLNEFFFPARRAFVRVLGAKLASRFKGV